MRLPDTLTRRGSSIPTGLMNNLARLLATHKDGKSYNPQKAMQLAQRVCQLTSYRNPTALDTLAVAYAANGDFSQAIETAKRAVELANAQQQKDLAEKIQNHLRLYKASKPFAE